MTIKEIGMTIEKIRISPCHPQATHCHPREGGDLGLSSGRVVFVVRVRKVIRISKLDY